MFKIQIGSLSEGVHEYEFSERAGEVGLTESFRGDVRVSVMLEKTGRQMVLKAVVKADAEFVCDRCAVPFSLPVNSSYRMCYVTEAEQFKGVDPAEMQVIDSGAGTLDITEDVRQTVMLAVPLKLLCSENCKGLCPYCGTNLNTGTCSCTGDGGDTRWEALRSLKGSN